MLGDESPRINSADAGEEAGESVRAKPLGVSLERTRVKTGTGRVARGF